MKRLALIPLISALLLVNPIQAEDSSQNQEIIFKCIASWYSEDDPGILKTTANMEIFNDKGLTCAMWDVPFGTMLEVTNLNNGKTVVVRVNDRGPAKRLVDEGRLIDLTKNAFSKIASLEDGLIFVKVQTF
ncbi:MAG: septal ring lytic transglycosylase RlpA family protein [Candidatus Omnitrophota bacterium]